MTQTLIDEQLFVTRLSQKSSSTSIAGAEHAKYRAGGQVAKVYEAIRDCGEHGATDAELAAALGLERSTICARRFLLLARGLIVKAGTRASQWGIQNRVYRAK